MKVYKVKYESEPTTINNLSMINDQLVEVEVGERMIIDVCEMSEEEFDALPEC